MKTDLFLILLLLLDFIQLMVCIDPADVSKEVCPAKLLRRKRAINEYTRWRSNIDTTSEFIVKVLDDDITTSSSNQIKAVNILPVTHRVEKIIVGGAMVPMVSTASATTEALPKDYTRFMPPTQNADKGSDLSLTPIMPPQDVPALRPEHKGAPYFLPKAAAKNTLRGDSPPVAPKFVTRLLPSMNPRQYAPIAPVVFPRRHLKIKPLTPPMFENLPYMQPTRSSPPVVPSRTAPDEFPFFQAFIGDPRSGSEIPIRHESENEKPMQKQKAKEFERTTTQKTVRLFENDEFETFHATLKPPPELDLIIKKDYEKQVPEIQDVHTENLDKENQEADSKNEQEMYYIDDTKNEKDDNRRVLDLDDESKQILQYLRPNATTTPYESPSNENITNEASTDYNESSEALVDETTTETDGSFSAPPHHSGEKSRDKRRPICNMIKLRPFNFKTPGTLPEIVAQMKQWAEESPIVNWIDITGGNLTTMENPIYVMIVDDTSVGQVASEKLNALLVAGIQGRDHHAVTGLMYILYQLIERTDTHLDILSKYRFFVIPVFNPDGYDYAMTFPHRRQWMKNLRQSWDICKNRESCQFCESHGLRCIISPCYGVNLDRNFEYQWIPPTELQAEHPCGNLYAGTRQLSEPETQALSTYLERLNTHMNVFIAFKEGDVLGIMYPYSHVNKRRPFDSLYRQKASRAAASAYSIAGRPYVAGQTSEFLPLYAGGIEDWADGHLGIDTVFTVVMFRPTDSHTKDLTEKVVHEAYAAAGSLLLSSISVQTLRPPIITLARAKAFKLLPTQLSICFACLATFLYS